MGAETPTALMHTCIKRFYDARSPPIPAHNFVVAVSTGSKDQRLAAGFHSVKEDNPQVIWRRKLLVGTDFKLSAPVWKLMLSPEGVVAAGRLG